MRVCEFFDVLKYLSINRVYVKILKEINSNYLQEEK